MKMKTLLLLSAAALTFSAISANAADAISDEIPAAVPEAPAPVAKGDSVAICDVAGVGYFVIPGSETCLKIGGAVDARFGYGSTKLSLGGVQIAKDRGARSRVEARLDLDTHTESDIGAIKSKMRIALNHEINKSVWNDNDDKDFGVELAYISVGPAYIGYKETLFNTQLAYGDYMNIDDRNSLNTLTAGVMVEDIGFGLYGGLAVEDWNRNQYIRSYESNGDTPDIVARVGLAGQSWGATDLSVIYSDHYDTWAIKSTSDFNVSDDVQARISAAYADVDGSKDFVVSGGLKYAFTEKVSAFGGAGYIWNKDDQDAYLANAGVVYTIVPGFDISGELGYSRFKDKNVDGKLEDVSSTLRFVRTF